MLSGSETDATSFGVAAPALAGSSQDFYKFSDGVKPWVAGADSPKYITKYTLYHKVEYAPTTQANGYAALTNRDAHAVWMQVPVQNPGNIVEIALDARSDDSCERCALLVYVGNAAPTSPWDFQKLDRKPVRRRRGSRRSCVPPTPGRASRSAVPKLPVFMPNLRVMAPAVKPLAGRSP